MDIDWARVAKPQPDHYDADVLAYLMRENFGWEKHTPTTPQTLVGETVGVCRDPNQYQGADIMDDFYNDDLTRLLDDAVLVDIERYLRGWDDGYLSIGLFLDDFWPKIMPNREGVRGCSSGHEIMTDKWTRNSVYVTINDAQGCAEGIYHEVGHLRLRAVGIAMEDHDGVLMENQNNELYDSPVRFDVKRPMSAVVQGLYSWIVFSENDLACAAKYSVDDSLCYLRGNLPKIANGIAEVRRFVRPTPAGQPFFESMLTWGDSIIERGNALIAARK